MRKTILVTAIAAIVLAVGGIAVASIPDSNGVIHACRKLRTGALRVIDSEAGQTCDSKTEAPLTWNQTGPQGLAGPAGISGYEIVRHDVQAATLDQDVRAFAECPTGKKVLGGGSNADLPDQVIQRSEPTTTGTAWDLQVHSISPLTTPISIHVFAICATTS